MTFLWINYIIVVGCLVVVIVLNFRLLHLVNRQNQVLRDANTCIRNLSEENERYFVEITAWREHVK